MPTGGGEKKYHHGALRTALLGSAEAILARAGVAGLSMRAAARDAGVSHAAPAYHFGDLAGLLSELAVVGFDRFADHLTRAIDAAPAETRFRAMGLAYVDFAARWPELFLLMFRSDALDRRPALVAAQQRAFAVLSTAADERRGRDGEAEEAHADAIAAWSIVHGLAMLLLDRRLPPEAWETSFIDAVLARLGRDPRAAPP